MALVEVPIAIGFGEGFSLPFEGQTCDNLIPQAPQTLGTSSPGALYQSPGIKQFGVAGSGPHRGELAVAGEPFWVSGDGLFTSDQFGDVTRLGTINGTSRVSIAGNGITVAIIVPGEIGYFFDVENGLKEITDLDFLDFMNNRGGVFSVVFVSSFFVYTSPTEFFNGSLRTENKGQNFDALDVGSADSSPDNIVAAFAFLDELYIFSSESVQVFQATAATTAPFVNVPGGLIQKGLSSQHAVVEFANAFAFLGGGKGDPVSVWQGRPGSASKISTAAVDNVIAQYRQQDIETAFMSVYGEIGSQYLILSLPDDTLIFDATTSRLMGRPVWHTRSTNGGAWDVAGVLKAFGKVLVGSATDGKIGELSLSFTTEFDVTPTREFAGAYFQDKTNAIFMSNVELVAESGVGLALSEPDGTDPEVELLISTDGARSFDSLGSRKLGKQGVTEQRMRWNRLGRTPLSAIFKFRTQEPVKIAFRKVAADITAGRTL